MSWASSRPRKLVWRVRRCGLQGAQFVDGHQLLGVRLDHRGDADGGFGQGQLQLALPGGRVGDAGLLGFVISARISAESEHRSSR